MIPIYIVYEPIPGQMEIFIDGYMDEYDIKEVEE